MDLATMHADPEIQKKLRQKIGKIRDAASFTDEITKIIQTVGQAVYISETSISPNYCKIKFFAPRHIVIRNWQSQSEKYQRDLLRAIQKLSKKLTVVVQIQQH
jgi:hypothetical protein